MNNMSIILLLILITYQTVASVMDMRDIKKRKGIDITEKMRLDFYKETIIWGWVPVCIIFLFIIFTSMSLQDIGLRKIVLSDFMWLNIIVFIIMGIVVISLAYQVIMYFSKEEFRKETAIEIENKKNSDSYYDKVVFNLIVPRTLKEKKYFLFVSLTAGICEEIHLRGCLIFLLRDILPDLHIAVIGVGASLLFGVFHCYQGLSGIIKTSILGVLFVAIYFATDSLVPGIVLHFLFDFSSAFLVRGEIKV